MEIKLPDKFKDWGITDFELCECEEDGETKSFYISAKYNNATFLSMRYLIRKSIPDSVYFGCGVQAALDVLRAIMVQKEGVKIDANQ